jgi:hypothetical protein
MYEADIHNDITSVKLIFLVKDKIVCHFSKNNLSSSYHGVWSEVVGIFHSTVHWSVAGLWFVRN